MSEPIQWSKNPELWAFRAKRLKLRAAIDQARIERFHAEKQHIEREYRRLRERWRQLAEDARFAKARNDPRAKHRLAGHIAAFYRDIGIIEAYVDSVLDRVATVENVGLSTG